MSTTGQKKLLWDNAFPHIFRDLWKYLLRPLTEKHFFPSHQNKFSCTVCAGAHHMSDCVRHSRLCLSSPHRCFRLDIGTSSVCHLPALSSSALRVRFFLFNRFRSKHVKPFTFDKFHVKILSWHCRRSGVPPESETQLFVINLWKALLKLSRECSPSTRHPHTRTFFFVAVALFFLPFFSIAPNKNWYDASTEIQTLDCGWNIKKKSDSKRSVC